jgi:hypothetical protein
MTFRKIIIIALLLLVGASIVMFIARQAGIISPNLVPFLSSSDGPRHKIIAYYFHGTVRCPTCPNIERYTDKALKTHFADYLADGKLEWRAINREEPPNEHFAQDYQLYSQALIIVDSIPGEPSEWKNLEAIWDHAGDKATFIEYVRTEVDQYLRRL